ncbi:MAG TPA: hypothetical protein VFW94_12765 [Candidatus Acidoferrales bacterium]|nr:hypothetical protein [Candidatus Acidoferrales bacterium]
MSGPTTTQSRFPKRENAGALRVPLPRTNGPQEANRDPLKIKTEAKFFKTIEKRFSNRDSHGSFLLSSQHSQSFTLTTLGDGHAMPSNFAASPAASMKVEKLMDTLFNGLKGGFS